MEIEKARSYGFCFGVKRAVEMAENSPNGYTLGPLIHNPLEIDRLKRLYNVHPLSSIEEVDPQKVKRIIIRTHGIPKQDLEKLQKLGVEIVDATCPFVKKPQEIVEKMSREGYDIVIFGDKNHPEIKGVRSYALHDRVFVVLKPEELEGVPLKERIAVVAQTTRKVDQFQEIVDYLIRRGKEIRVFNTICNATFENQEAVRELAQRADVMVIIGGKNSSNTRQLYTIARNYTDAYLVEEKGELNPNWFKGKKLCGISAGASTPEWLVDQIIGEIQKITQTDKLETKG